MNHELQGHTFTAPDGRLQYFTSAVLKHITPAAVSHVLEIGCGIGRLLTTLAGQMPQADFVGLDISEGNIRRARELTENAHLGDRVQLLCADYLSEPLGQHDLIVAESVVHLMGAPAPEVFRKIAGELAAGGKLVMTLPMGGAFNAALWSARRLFALARCRALDEAILLAARLLHGGSYSVEELRERVPYMYLLPAFHDGAALRTVLGGCGLRVVHEEAVPHASLAQPKHCLLVAEKAAA